MSVIVRTILTAIIAYLLGSMSFAVIFTRGHMNRDIRDLGSGNAGFTNVLRSVGVVPAVLTILFDFLKGVVAALIGWWIFSGVQGDPSVTMHEYASYGRYLAGVCAIIGHSYPVFFGFRGGKGVTTAAAMMSVVDIRVFLAIISTFLIIFACTRIVSLASLACAALYPVYTCVITYFGSYLSLLGTPDALRLRYVFLVTLASAAVGVFVIIKHTDNIRRLVRGEEKVLKIKKD